MDQENTRSIVEAHAQAVVDPIDIEHVQRDMISELHPELPAIAEMLPQPVTEATVASFEPGDDHAVAVITYSNAEKSISVRSRWEDRGAGQPQIVEAAPVS